MKIVIGSRGSRLALWQVNWVKDRLESSGHSVEIQIIKTSGDKFQSASLQDSGTKGLFIKEIEEALLSRQVDLAVHSLKDLPTEQPDGLVIAAVPERDDPRDVLVARNGLTLMALPPGARIGTGSLRRQAQLRARRPDLNVIPLRGNVDTRLNKLDRGECDALVLAGAGLKRLGFSSRITSWFDETELCPAVGQGALAIEAHKESAPVLNAARPLDHAPTHCAVRAERALLRALGGGCQLPIAALASYRGDALRLSGVVADPAGRKVLRATLTGAADDPDALGNRVAGELIEQGAQALLSADYADHAD
jgi:hydroxymethylbilane synthase